MTAKKQDNFVKKLESCFQKQKKIQTTVIPGILKHIYVILEHYYRIIKIILKLDNCNIILYSLQKNYVTWV